MSQIKTTIQHRTYQGSQKINKDEESHREAAHPTKLGQGYQFAQVMHCGINPSPTLREQDAESFRCDSLCFGIRNELGPKCWEVLHQECRQVPIFAQGEQILLVQGVHVAFGVVIDHSVGDDNWSAFVSCTDTV